MEIFGNVVLAIALSATEINLDRPLAWIKSLLITIFSVLISLRLVNFALKTYTSISSTPDPQKFGLLISLSVFLIIVPLFLIIYKYRNKLNRNITNCPLNKSEKIADLATIFLVLTFMFTSLTELFPILQNILTVISFLMFFVLIVWLI
jgi:hypothetical protein